MDAEKVMAAIGLLSTGCLSGITITVSAAIAISIIAMRNMKRDKDSSS